MLELQGVHFLESSHGILLLHVTIGFGFSFAGSRFAGAFVGLLGEDEAGGAGHVEVLRVVQLVVRVHVHVSSTQVLDSVVEAAVVLSLMRRRHFRFFLQGFAACFLLVKGGDGTSSFEAFLLFVIVNPILDMARPDVHVPHVNLGFLSYSSSIRRLLLVGFDSVVLVAHEEVVGGEASALDVAVEEHQVGVAQPGQAVQG